MSANKNKTDRPKLVLESQPFHAESTPQTKKSPTVNIKPQSHGKSILRYPGGKSRAVKIILPKIQAQEAKTLISPFFGGGSIEFAWGKDNPMGQVRGIDIYPPVVCFWQHALSNPAGIADRVQRFYPLERERFYALQRELIHLDGDELAAAFYVLNRASFSGATMSGGMSPGHRRFTQSAIDRLRNFSAPNVSVSHGNVIDVLGSLLASDPSEAVIYLDPPYKLDDSVLYGDKGSTHKRFDHSEFAGICNKLSEAGHRFIISYNDEATIRALYPDLNIETASWAYGMKNISGSPMGASSEILIYSKNWNPTS